MFGRKKKKAKERSGAAGSADGDTESETSLISQSFNIQSRASEVSAPSSPAPSLGRLVPEAGAPDTLNRGGRPAYGNSGNAGGPAISDKKIMELDAKLKDNINVFENAILGLDERRQRFIDMERKSLQLDESVKIFRKSASDAKNKMWKRI
ncbi:hypothetical protein BC829DRAFT_491162 [Chytridium lagenaria]|nr:hypothetical protein BC829DRAFT_491162 [Chytridium lagenaria]